MAESDRPPTDEPSPTAAPGAGRTVGGPTPAPTRKGASAGTFVAALVASVVVSDLLRWWLIHTRDAGLASGVAAAGALNGGTALQIGFSVAFLAAVLAAVPGIRANVLPSRRLQKAMGASATLTMLISLIAVMVSIYRRKEAGYELLAESFALYLAINLVFLYWYWFADHPLRTDVLHTDAGVDMTFFARFDQGIRFPEEDLAAEAGRDGAWVPGITDYAYFTLLSSNCFGAPEGHVLIGKTLKLIQIVHTVFMIFVFIIIVSRAINTLS